MPGNDTSATDPRAPVRLPAALTSMPVQLVLLFVVLAAIDLACQWLGARLVHVTPAPLADAARLLAALLLSAAMIAAYRFLVRILERRSADELRSSGAVRALVPGVLVGAGLFALVDAILFALGAVSFGGLGGFAGVGRALATSIAAAVGEEIVFRGVVYRRLEERLGTSVALVVSAAAFGLVHAGNPGASWASTLAIALESGVLLALAYAATRSLWLPIGLHFGWNFTEGGIFGAAVSGGRTSGLISTTLAGPPLITGGAFGPEASLAALAVSLSASIALAWYVVHTGRWRPSRWRLRRAEAADRHS
jgi:membrane protease YdiL (CAAX protease family)